MNPAQLLDTTVTGAGSRTVVFANGFATTQEVWADMLPAVAADWRVVRFDYVGTTPSTTPRWLPERYATYAGHADDLVRLLQHLDVRNAVLVGHSMSGMIGALAGLQVPERIGHLVMIGASPCYRNDGDYEGGFSDEDIATLLHTVDADLSAWMGGFSPTLLGRDATPQQLRACLDTVLGIRPDIGRSLLRSFFTSDYRALLPSLQVPTTIIQTANDVAVPVAVGHYLARHTRNTGLHTLPVSGHLPHVTHPQLVAPLVQAVLTSHAVPTVPSP